MNAPVYPQEFSSVLRNLAGNGFVAGPTLLQRICVAFRLSAGETRVLLEGLRLAVEPPAGELYETLAHRLEISRKALHRLIVGLTPHIVAPHESEPLAFLSPFLRTLMDTDWYGPYRVGRPSPRRRPVHIGSRDVSKQPDLFVFTGFLGSGKTTLINRLLLAPEMASSLVVINEAGDVAVDHLVVQALSNPQDLMLLRNGCLCCAFGDALTDTLYKLVERRNCGEGPYFDRLVVETSGMADPIALIHALQQDRKLREAVNFRGVCTTVDGLAVERGLLLAPEIDRQIEAANWIVLTKTDLIDPENLQAVVEQVRGRNHAAEVFALNSFDGELLRTMLGDRVGALRQLPYSLRPARHDAYVSVATIRRGKIEEKVARLFLDLLALAKGDELYRVKGILALSGQGNPLIFQAVRSNFHELMCLDQAAAESGLTIIGRNIAESGVDRLLAALERCSSNEG